MKISTVVLILIAVLFLLLPETGFAAGEDPVAALNARLSRSRVERIDGDGLVTVATPDRTMTFNLKQSVFTVNDRNDDDRLRVSGDYAIRVYDDGRLDETLHRQSFLCRSRKEAREVVEILQRLKREYLAGDERARSLDRPISLNDPAVKYTGVNQAIDFINDKLEVSMIVGVDDRGILLVNAPDCLYRVDLHHAEFGVIDANDAPKVRFYGEWCIRQVDEDKEEKVIARESFLTHYRSDTWQVVRALYAIKSAFTGADAAKADAMVLARKSRIRSYTTVDEAVRYINDRLEISIIMGIDGSGRMIINASDSIFKFRPADCRFRRGRRSGAFDLLRILDGDRIADAVAVEGRNAVQRHTDGRWLENLDEQNFQCRSSFAVDEVTAAFHFIKKALGGTK